jgi:hypothetical protein
MNMDKLTRYNQKLLAIIGTSIIVTAVVLLLIGLGGLIISLIDFNDSDDHGLRVQNQKMNQNDSTEIVRTQEITFSSPVQLDTSQAKYIIPVGQVNLENEEKIRLESGGGFKFSGSSYRYQSYYGLFNNFIYYDHRLNFSKKIFNERIAITHWAFLKKESIEVLLFKGTTTDDNSDNQMDNDDYQSLFVYFISDDELKQYKFDNQTVLEFEPMNKTEFVAVQLGIDKDNDFDFERIKEPKDLVTLNLFTREIHEIVPKEMKEEIQNTIDGIEK